MSKNERKFNKERVTVNRRQEEEEEERPFTSRIFHFLFRPRESFFLRFLLGKAIWGPTDRPSIHPSDIESYRGALLAPKNSTNNSSGTYLALNGLTTLWRGQISELKYLNSDCRFGKLLKSCLLKVLFFF